MPSKEDVLRLVEEGRSYEEIGREFGIPPGQAYLVATGVPADGGDTVTRAQRERPGVLPSHTQRLVNAREVQPAVRSDVHEWVRRRAWNDPPMRAAAQARAARKQAAEQARKQAGSHAAEQARGSDR